MYNFILLGRNLINKRLLKQKIFKYKSNIIYCGSKIVEEKYKNDFTNASTRVSVMTGIYLKICELYIFQIETLSFSQKLVVKSPTSIQPYLKLMRIDKPIGSWLIIWPSSWGVAITASPGSLPDPYLITIFTLGSFLMRGIGCTVNDMLDREIDSNVL